MAWVFYYRCFFGRRISRRKVARLAGLKTTLLGHRLLRANRPMHGAPSALTRGRENKKSRGVPRFVMVSTCSVYGIAGAIVSETSPTGPLTAYAAAKLRAEADIQQLASDNFCPVFLRPATAFGTSARLRLDLVLNNLTA